MKNYEVDRLTRNYDYSKYAVYADNGDYLTSIFKHCKVYYTLFDRTPFESVEDCLDYLKRHFKKRKGKR